MFKRLQQGKGARQQSAGDTFVESPPYEVAYSMSQNNLAEAGQLTSHLGAFQSTKPPGPPREPPTTLPILPFETSQPPSSTQTKYRPASSIYSQPSPNMLTGRFPRDLEDKTRYGTEAIEVSPPSSPDVNKPQTASGRLYPEAADSPDISPIDEVPQALGSQNSRPGSKTTGGGSSIPILRREKRRNQVAEAAASLLARREAEHEGPAKRTPTNTHWDPYYGEPTTSEKGRPQQVKPSSYTLPATSINNGNGIDGGPSAHSSSSTPSASKVKASFGDRVRRLKEHNNNTIMTDERPAWKGSSGRSKFIPPVKEDTSLPPLSIPRKSSKRATSPRFNGSSGASTPVNDTPVVSPTTHGAKLNSSIRSEPPPSTGQPSYTPNSASYGPSPTETNQPRAPMISSYQSTAQSGLASLPSQTQKPLPQSPPTTYGRDDSTSTIERNFREALKDVNFPSQRAPEVSRFSVTTYATTAAASSPRVSSEDVPPLPEPPSPSPQSQSQSNSMLNRRRPKVGSGFDSATAITRKAVGEPVFIRMSDTTTSSPRNSRQMPKTPVEKQNDNRILSLQGQLEELKRKRVNLEKTLHQITHYMPRDIGIGMEARRQAEEKKKVESLREELAEVQRQEHDLGMRLHRAWKRRDQNAIYEPTGLWVRRITT